MGQDQKVHDHVHLDRVRGIQNRNVSARPSRRHANAKCERERASENGLYSWKVIASPRNLCGFHGRVY